MTDTDIPPVEDRITIPFNHIQRVGDGTVLLRLMVKDGGRMHALPVFLTSNEAADLARRLEEYSR